MADLRTIATLRLRAELSALRTKRETYEAILRSVRTLERAIVRELQARGEDWVHEPMKEDTR